MSYQNFKPTYWASLIERELEKNLVFAEDCNRQYEGTIQEAGDSVRILGVGKPTVTTIANSTGDFTLAGPETVEDTDVTMKIDRVSTINYMVGNIDKMQASGDAMEALAAETTEALADEADKYIASLAASKFAVKDASSAYQITDATILAKIDNAIQKLMENNVKPSTEIVITCSPRFYFMLKRAYTDLDTNNSAMIANGRVGKYGNVTVKMSNNVATANNKAEDLIMVRTKRAIAYVHAATKLMPYVPENKMADAIKGFMLYNAKIVRPKELVVMNVKYTA